MATHNQTVQTAADQTLIDGLLEHASELPSLVLGMQTLQNADIVSRLQERIASAKATASARVIYLAAVGSNRNLRAAQLQFVDDLKQTLRARFSNSPTILADFGLTARTRATPKPETLVAAAAKAKATRAKRGTKGSKQLSQVQGDVTGVVVTPVKMGAPVPEPANAPAPAPVASASPAPQAPQATPKS